MTRFTLRHAARWAGVGVGIATLALVALPATSYAATSTTSSTDPATGTNSSEVTMGGTTNRSVTTLDNDQGRLAITVSKSHPGDYKATWTDSLLVSGNSLSLYLVGLNGNHADSLTGSIAAIATGQVTSPGTGVVYFPESQGGTKTHPVTFEMHTPADLESLPFAQLPEVPWTAALPLAAAIPVIWGFKRRLRQPS